MGFIFKIYELCNVNVDAGRQAGRLRDHEQNQWMCDVWKAHSVWIHILFKSIFELELDSIRTTFNIQCYFVCSVDCVLYRLICTYIGISFRIADIVWCCWWWWWWYKMGEPFTGHAYQIIFIFLVNELDITSSLCKHPNNSLTCRRPANDLFMCVSNNRGFKKVKYFCLNFFYQ